MPDGSLSTQSKLTPAASKVIAWLIVDRGLSYAAAIAEARRLAVEAAAPYNEAADSLQAVLDKGDERYV